MAESKVLQDLARSAVNYYIAFNVPLPSDKTELKQRLLNDYWSPEVADLIIELLCALKERQ